MTNQESETIAKGSNYRYYLDIRSDGTGVGPHTPAKINWWLEHRKITPEILARRIDQDKWVKLSEIKRFSNFLQKIARLPAPTYEKDRWEDDPVTEKQLKKLAFFDLPFPETNLSKGEASRLISFFAGVDPERESQYQNQPAEEEKLTKLRELIKKLPTEERTEYSVTASLTKGEVAEAMYEIESRLEQLEDEKTKLENKKHEEELELMFIDHHFNQEEIREYFGYKKLTQKHVKFLREYLPTHEPDWSRISFRDTGEIVLKLFPELKKAEKTLAAHGRKHAENKGCFSILVLLIGMLLYALKETLPRIG